MKVANQQNVNHSPDKKSRLVLIDDDPMFCNTMRSLAGVYDMPLDCYGSILELDQWGDRERYDMIIVDYHLEHNKGVEVADYLNSLFGDIPIMLISADNSDTIKVNTLPKNFVDFSSKTQGFASLFAKINSHLKTEAVDEFFNPS